MEAQDGKINDSLNSNYNARSWSLQNLQNEDIT